MNIIEITENKKEYLTLLLLADEQEDICKEEIQLAKEENREPVLLPHFTAHHLRHTFCTRFCENETNLKVIQEIMGHSDISTTMDIYAEATDEKKYEHNRELCILTFTNEDYHLLLEGRTFFELIKAKKLELQLASNYQNFLKDNMHESTDEINKSIRERLL